MFLISILFKIFCCLIVIILTLGTASATVFLSENWDSGTPPACWPNKNLPSSCCPNPFNGWYGRNWDCNVLGGKSGGLVTNPVHSGTRSMHVIRESGQSFGTDIYKDIPEPHPTKMYFRAYFYFPNSWLTWDVNTANCGESIEHWIYFNSAAGGASVKMNINDCSPWPPNPPGGNPHCFTYGQQNAYFIGQCANRNHFGYETHPSDCWKIQNNLNRWVCIEWMWDYPNQKYALWIDGVQKVGTGGNGVDQTLDPESGDWYRIILSMFRSGCETPGICTPVSEYYIDDIVISDQYIGPMGGGDTTPPASPSSLRIQNN